MSNRSSARFKKRKRRNVPSNNPIASPEVMHQLLRSSKVGKTVQQLEDFFVYCCHHKHLFSRLFYPFFVDMLDELFGYQKKRCSWILHDDFPDILGVFGPPERSLSNEDRSGFYAAVFECCPFPPSFDLPYSRLPAPSRQRIASGDITGLSPFYAGKRVKPDSPLEVTMQEYFFYCMAFYPVHDFASRLPARREAKRLDPFSFGGRKRPVSNDPYLDLLEAYLKEFFPLRGGRSNDSSSNADLFATPRGNMALQVPMGMVGGVGHATPARHGLEHAGRFTPQQQQNSKDHTSRGMLVPALNVKVNTGQRMLMVLAEFWLHQNSHSTPPEERRQQQQYFQQQQHQYNMRGQQRAFRPPALQHHLEPPYRLPGTLLLESIDITVTHMLSQVSFQQAALSPGGTSMTPELKLLQQALYVFLRAAFTRWDVESAKFQMIITIWLRWIRPWKQAGKGLAPAAGSSAESEADTDTDTDTDADTDSDSEGRTTPGKKPSRVLKHYHSGWRLWVADNLVFYTVLLEDYLRMTQTFDFGVSSHVKYLNKVLETMYHDKELHSWLCECEQRVLQADTIASPGMGFGAARSMRPSPGGGHWRTPAPTRRINRDSSKDDPFTRALHSHMTSFLGAVALYRPVFNPEVMQQCVQMGRPVSLVGQFTAEIAQSVHMCRPVMSKKRTRYQRRDQTDSCGWCCGFCCGWVCWLCSCLSPIFFSDSGSSSSTFKASLVSPSRQRQEEQKLFKRRVRPYDKLLQELDKYFGVKVVDTTEEKRGTYSKTRRRRDSGGDFDSHEAERHQNAGGFPFLTPYGRKKLKTGESVCSALDVEFYGDVWDRPLTSWESRPLLWFFKWLSDSMNIYGLQFEQCQAVEESDMCHRLSMGEVRRPEFGSPGPRCWFHGGFRHPYKRVNLRALADMRNLVFVMLCVAFVLWLLIA